MDISDADSEKILPAICSDSEDNESNSKSPPSVPAEATRRILPIRNRRMSLKAIENLVLEESPEPKVSQRPKRLTTANKKYKEFVVSPLKKTPSGHKNKRRSQTTTTSDEDSEESETDLHLRSPRAVGVGKSTDLFEDRVDVEGQLLFGFRTPKKRHGMAAMASTTPKTPKTYEPQSKSAKKDLTKSSAKRSPRSAVQNGSERMTPKTPKTPKTPVSSRRRASVHVDSKTPSHIRNKVKRELSKLAMDSSDSDFSADASEYEPESEQSSSEDEIVELCSSEDDDDDDQKTPTKPKSSKPTTSKPISTVRQSTRLRNRTNNEDYVPESDLYFSNHSSNKVVTSDHTLARLKNPRLPHDQLFGLLASMTISSEHETAVTNLLNEYKSHYSKWLYVLNEGYNIMLYGLGSKRTLLIDFQQEMLSDQPVVVVNGFFPGLTIKDILDSITGGILDLTTTSSNQHEVVDIIEEEFSYISDTHLFLIVHNIDGPMLRNSKAQDILSRLATVQNIHLLASMDHINTPLLWDHSKLSNYNFLWWDVTTMLPYSNETAFENSLLVQNSGELALSSMRNVFQSLTTNSKGIYMVIAKNQLKNKGNPNYQGMPFKDLYWGCREAFLVSSDLALRAQLTEFLDHKLVKTKRTVDGTEHLTIPINSSLLEQFVEQQS